jgi:hypothetical protein
VIFAQKMVLVTGNGGGMECIPSLGPLCVSHAVAILCLSMKGVYVLLHVVIRQTRVISIMLHLVNIHIYAINENNIML